MKYIQAYENKYMTKPVKYNIGDYVILDNKKEYRWTCLTGQKTESDYSWVYEDEIKAAEPHEVDAIKYNL